MGTAKAIVFDLDDTLYPEVDYVRSGFAVVAARLARPGRSAEDICQMLWRTFEKGPRQRVFNTVLRQLGQSDDDQVIAELVGVYRCHRPCLKLQEDVAPVLNDLHSRYKLGLITDGFLPGQQLKVEALQLEKFFDHIIYTEQLGRRFWKPAAKAFQLMAQALQCPPSQCVYIADNVSKDFVSPNQLGWHSAQLKRPNGVHGDVPPAPDGQPREIIESVTELPDLLAKW